MVGSIAVEYWVKVTWRIAMGKAGIIVGVALSQTIIKSGEMHPIRALLSNNTT